MTVTGLLLAAGAGRRMGIPKALVTLPSGEPFVSAGIHKLRDGGCDSITVVLGAGWDTAAPMVTDGDVVRALHWELGLGESLRVGLQRLQASDAHAALVMLVDLPDVSHDVVHRVLNALPSSSAVLGRATYQGVPGHPVLIGRDHWAGVLAGAEGDQGARAYLAAHDVANVECGDLASGRDVDTPSDERDMRRPRTGSGIPVPPATDPAKMNR